MDVHRRLHVGQILQEHHEAAKLKAKRLGHVQDKTEPASLQPAPPLVLRSVLLQVLEVDDLLVELLERRDLPSDVNLDTLHDVAERPKRRPKASKLTKTHAAGRNQHLARPVQGTVPSAPPPRSLPQGRGHPPGTGVQFASCTRAILTPSCKNFSKDLSIDSVHKYLSVPRCSVLRLTDRKILPVEMRVLHEGLTVIHAFVRDDGGILCSGHSVHREAYSSKFGRHASGPFQVTNVVTTLHAPDQSCQHHAAKKHFSSVLSMSSDTKASRHCLS